MMLWSDQAGTPWPGSAAEWAGLIAGLAFACNNVLSRLAGQRHPTMRPEMRTVVVFTGCALVGFPAALMLDGVRTVPAAFSQSNTWLLLAGMACVLVGGNAMVQRGLPRGELGGVRVRARRAQERAHVEERHEVAIAKPLLRGGGR